MAVVHKVWNSDKVLNGTVNHIVLFVSSFPPHANCYPAYDRFAVQNKNYYNRNSFKLIFVVSRRNYISSSSIFLNSDNLFSLLFFFNIYISWMQPKRCRHYFRHKRYERWETTAKRLKFENKKTLKHAHNLNSFSCSTKINSYYYLR